MSEQADKPYGGTPAPRSRITEETLRDWEASFDNTKLAAAAEIRRLQTLLVGLRPILERAWSMTPNVYPLEIFTRELYEAELRTLLKS